MTATLNDTPDVCQVCISALAVEFGLCETCLRNATWLLDPPWND